MSKLTQTPSEHRRSNPNTRASAEDVPAFLERMHGAVSQLGLNSSADEQAEPVQEYTPAVTPRKSLSSPDHIISLIDGKAYKTLKRHLAGHGLTPAQYRERYGLKSDYPMVASSYAETRRDLAKKIGLGRKPGEKVTKAKATAAAPENGKAAAASKAKAPAAKKPAAAKSAGRKKLACSSKRSVRQRQLNPEIPNECSSVSDEHSFIGASQTTPRELIFWLKSAQACIRIRLRQHREHSMLAGKRAASRVDAAGRLKPPPDA